MTTAAEPSRTSLKMQDYVQVVSFRLGHEDYAIEITKVYAAPAFRGSGLAQALFAEALAFAEQGGFGAMMLWSDTRFARGHRFYEKLGFRRWPGERYLADVSATWEYHFRLDLAGAR